jgi:hypothetical protein
MSIPNPYASAGVVIPTTTTTTCIPNYVSITLQQGNSFVLPPGATLVGVSDKDNVQSDCVDLDALEEFGCYLFYYNVVDVEIDPGLEYPQEQVKIVGLAIDGVFYEFNTPVVDNGDGGLTTPTTLLTEFNAGLASISFSSVIINTTVGSSSPDNANCRVFCFQTIPSIASKMQVKIQDTTTDIVNPFYFLPLYTWATKPSDISSDALADCLCNPSYTTTTTIP